MGQYDDIFNGIANAKPMSNFAPRLGAGRHRLILKHYGIKDSRKFGKMVESDFQVLTSNTLEPGDTRSYPWFVSAPGDSAQYEQDRARTFLTAVGKCIEDTRSTQEIGADLITDAQPGRGLVIDCEVIQKVNQDGSPKLSAGGQPTFITNWSPVAQSFADIEDQRKKLDAGVIAAKAATQPVGPVAGQEPAKTGFGGLAGFKRS